MKERTLKENKKLIELGLVFGNFGNVSMKFENVLYIKPSGIDLDLCKPEEISAVKIRDEKFISGKNPSSDTPTHLELYKAFPNIGGISHTHSLYATAWAQSRRPIPCFGTTHADYWCQEIPLTRELSTEEINGDYEKETGKVIIEKINQINLNPLECPGILVSNHGPFTWGKTIEEAVKHAELLEYIAKLAWMTLQIDQDTPVIKPVLSQRHFSRKHGPQAYYGQQN